MKSELGSKMNYASQFEAAEPEPMVTVSLVAGLTTPRPPRCAGDMPRCLQHQGCSCPDLGVLQQHSAARTAAAWQQPGYQAPSPASREIRYFKVTKELIAI